MKKSMLMLIMAAGLLFLASCGRQATASAMQLVKTEGEVSVSDGGGKDISLFRNMRLYSGYHIFTRKESYAWINLDSTKLAKMDMESEIEIQKKNKDLEIIVNSGSLYFNITERLSDDETLNIKSSTMAVGIHGTCGWVEVADEAHMKVYILEGTVQCTASDSGLEKNDAISVSGGEMAEIVLYPDGQQPDGQKPYAISKSKFTEQEIADFVLNEVGQDQKLCEKILEESGLDVMSRWEEVKPEVTLAPETATPSSAPDATGFEPADDHAINWKDTNLEAAVRDITGIYGRDILLSDVIDRDYLNLLYSDIQDISALGELRNLTRLGLSGNSITDISALSSLANLEELTLADNQIADISALEHLTALTGLDLNRNQITDISALRSLTNLRSLNLAENQLADISALRGLANLSELNLMGNQISDISSLGSLTNLSTLSLNGNQIGDIAALGSLTKLTVLSLENNQVANIQALGRLTNLSRLTLNDNRISDVSALRNLMGLTALYLENNQITDVAALGGLQSLTDLGLVGNPVTDYSPIEFVPNVFR